MRNSKFAMLNYYLKGKYYSFVRYLLKLREIMQGVVFFAPKEY